jgi:3-oxoacyl-[acyl-carrier-protein] synthase-3
VRIIGSGSLAPPRVLTNHDLAEKMDTSHEWIVQRTGIHRRHICDPETESEFTLATEAMRRALDDAGCKGSDLDLLIHASVTSEMACPSNACRIANELNAAPCPAFDLLAACSGFAYGINLADSLIRAGRHRRIGVIGCDALSTVSDFTERTVSILFGDGAGAMVLERDDDPSVGCIYQNLGADGSLWEALYMPRRPEDVPEWDRENRIRLGCLRMSGREVFKFAVGKFREVIEDALEATGLGVEDISQFVCHQSNARIIEAAKERIGLPDEKVCVNIDEYGNTSSGSVGLVFDELWKAGKLKRGDTVVIVAFGGGMTWSSSVWNL